MLDRKKEYIAEALDEIRDTYIEEALLAGECAVEDMAATSAENIAKTVTENTAETVTKNRSEISI